MKLANNSARLLWLAVLAFGLMFVGLAVARPASAAPIATLPGFNNVRPVFQENGFVPFRATYVRCYTTAQWKKVTHGRRGVMGWYDGGSWIHVPSAACNNGAKLLNKGQLNPTNATAVATLMHEAIHRQGVKNEAHAECLSHWMTGHVIWQWTGSLSNGLAAFRYSRSFARNHLPARYWMTDSNCASFATDWGIRPLEEETAPPPVPPVTPPPPVPPPPPPPAPAQPVVVFDQSHTIQRPGESFPTWQINGARRIEVTFTASSGEGGWWTGPSSVLLDARPSGAERRPVGFAELKPGQSHSVNVDNLSGTATMAILGASPMPEQVLRRDEKGYVYWVPVYPGSLTVHVVGYR
jgi:hypothetical protein